MLSAKRMKYPTIIAAATLLAVASVGPAPAEAAAQAAYEQPSQVIESAAQQTLNALNTDRSVLGRYWRIATPT